MATSVTSRGSSRRRRWLARSAATAFVAALLPVGAGRDVASAAPVDTSPVYSNLTGTVTVEVDDSITRDGYTRRFQQRATFTVDLVEMADLGGAPYWEQFGATAVQDYTFHEMLWTPPPDGKVVCELTDRAAGSAWYPDAVLLLHVDGEYYGSLDVAELGVFDPWAHYEPDSAGGADCDFYVYDLQHTGVLDGQETCRGTQPSTHGVDNIGVYTETETTVTFHLDCTEVTDNPASGLHDVVHIVADLHGTKRNGRLQPLSPARVMDTRPGGWTVDGLYAGIGPRTAGSVTELQIAGRAGVPVDASAVVLNVAVTEPDADGYLTLYPCGSLRPLAASINYAAGQTISNAVTARLGTGGATCIYAYSSTHVVVDVTASYPADAGFAALVPARVLETRPGERTADGALEGIGLRPAGSVTEVPVAGRAGVPVNATAVVLNVAVTEPQAGGFLTIYPCGWTRPLAASLNYAPGETISNAVTAKVGDRGAICIYTLAAAHIVVDVTGAHPGGVGFVALSPARLLDTRPGEATVDGVSQGVGFRAAGATTEVVVSGRGNVPLTATTAVLNVAVSVPRSDGYLTIYPCGEQRPTAASINFVAGQTISNAVTAKIGAGGKVCVYTYAPTHIVIDVTAAHAT